MSLVHPTFGKETPVLDALRQSFRPITPLVGESIRYVLEDRLDCHDCPAVSLAVMQGGQLVEAAAFGLADRDTKRPVDSETLFQAASMSKPVAAVLAMQLVQEGRMDLDTDVNCYLTSWKIPYDRRSWPPVTLRGLLSHRSGATTVRFLSLHPQEKSPSTVDILAGRSPAINEPLVFSRPQGAAETYSNTGLTLVQLLIEDLCEQPLEELAQARIFKPLGLSRSVFAQPLKAELQSNAAVGHQSGRPMDGIWRYLPHLAAAGLWTTASDYAQLLLAIRAAARGEDERLLSPASAQAMLSSQGGGFGLGWMLWGEGVRLRFGHTGSNQGFRCLSTLSREHGDGLVVLTNADTGKQLYMEAVHGLAALCDWPDLAATPRSPALWTDQDLTSLVGTYGFDGDVAPPFRLSTESGRLLRSGLTVDSVSEPFFMDATGLIFSRDSFFALEITARNGGAVTKMRVLEDDKTEIGQVRRLA